ncbi:hypothetical protein NFO65_12780 [Neorhizobium galegae]|uniref:hypothetical protein n=1 Tax=Neorhizobium galegae TaxID=399 RepID=UPI00210106AD|nr:hypothetical protein [Neorhizobium galegae]MCQ1571611.1 hypothetical protein [Neorhizobium galegae]MCQ1837764.1 hypothetical protein [Neorhizobium galegae]
MSTIPSDSLRNVISNPTSKNSPIAKTSGTEPSFDHLISSTLNQMSAEAQSHFSQNIIEGNDANRDGYVTREEYTKNLMSGPSPKTFNEALQIWNTLSGGADRVNEQDLNGNSPGKITASVGVIDHFKYR